MRGCEGIVENTGGEGAVAARGTACHAALTSLIAWGNVNGSGASNLQALLELDGRTDAELHISQGRGGGRGAEARCGREVDAKEARGQGEGDEEESTAERESQRLRSGYRPPRMYAVEA